MNIPDLDSMRVGGTGSHEGRGFIDGTQTRIEPQTPVYIAQQYRALVKIRKWLGKMKIKNEN